VTDAKTRTFQRGKKKNGTPQRGKEVPTGGKNEPWPWKGKGARARKKQARPGWAKGEKKKQVWEKKVLCNKNKKNTVNIEGREQKNKTTSKAHLAGEIGETHKGKGVCFSGLNQRAKDRQSGTMIGAWEGGEEAGRGKRKRVKGKEKRKYLPFHKPPICLPKKKTHHHWETS